MKHLYIIGNGFDIYTGLATRYSDFRLWLENSYPFIYENLQAVYDIDAEWWNDFELQLGKLDVNKFVKQFTPPEKSIDEIMAEIEQRKKLEEKYGSDMLPGYPDSYCAKCLRGMLDVLHYCFGKWIEDQHRVIINPQYLRIEKEDSFFINFNYTDVLELLYKIPEERILHIHGRLTRRERLIYGHNMFLSGSSMDHNEDKVCFELNKYQKNPYEHIYKHEELNEVVKDVEYVHIYGFSFSTIDEDYIDWVFKNVSSRTKWEVSWFTNEDKNRIDRFVLEHWGLKDRLKIIRLEEVAQNEGI